MKILAISNLFPPEVLGGYELGCAQAVDALRRRGNDVLVVTSVARRGDHLNDRGVVRALELPPIYDEPVMSASHEAVRKHINVSASWVNPANINTLANIIHEYEPDVVYLWNVLGLGGLGILGLLRHLGVPWAWHIMDMVPLLLCGAGADAVSQIANEFGGFAEGHYIACSTHVVEENRAGGVELGKHVEILPNWIDDERAPRERQFFSGGELKLMCAVGVLGEHKGIDILIETASILHDRGYANFSIDVFGSEKDPRFRQMLYKHEVSDTVRFLGLLPQPELIPRYADYDLFIFPTWAREPFGFAPLEAAAAGCVPLFSAACGISEWMVDGVHCLKADRSAVAFADRIVNVLRGEVDIGEIGRRASAVVHRDFHIDVLVPRIEEVLEEAAAERLPARGPAADYYGLAQFAAGLLPVLVAEARD